MSKNKYWLIGLGTLAFIAVITIGWLILSPSQDKPSQKASAPAPADNGIGPVSKPQEPAFKPEAGTARGSGDASDNGAAGGQGKPGGANGNSMRSGKEDNKAGAALPSGGKKPVAEQGGGVFSSSGITPEYAGTFISDDIHQLEGKAIIYTKDGRKLVRIIDLKAKAGAELHVILTKKGARAAEGKDLGKIAANKPVQELEISENADFNQFNQLIMYDPASNSEYGTASLDKF